MSYKNRNFTVIEMLVAVTIIAILASMLLPALSGAREKARFARWLQFNKQCSTDPACIINLNFQEGEGDILNNSAKGHEGEGFEVKEYYGNIIGDFEWGTGRWVHGKKALQFDGASTYIDFNGKKFVDFDCTSDFTFIVWVKFDVLDNWDGIFGKCYMRNSANGYPQYALYSTGSSNTSLISGEIGNVNIVPENMDTTIDTENWYQMVMRSKISGDNQNIDLFLNGKKLGTKTTSLNNCELSKDGARLTVGCILWLLNSSNCNGNGNGNDSDDDSGHGNDNDGYDEDNPGNSNGSNGNTYRYRYRDPNASPDNFFKGKIDEFLVYSRALTDSEIRANYSMGAKHL